MTNKKWLAPLLPYLAVWAGIYLFNNAWFALIGFHVAILLTLAIAQPDIPIRILVTSNHPKWILGSVLVCSTSGVGLYFLWEVLKIAYDLPSYLQSIGLTSPASWMLFILYFSLVNPFIEEYFWRGYLGSKSKNLEITDLVYAGYHALILWGIVHPILVLFAVLILISAGWFWRQVAREDGGLLAAVLGHMAADFLILLAVYLKAG
jgi:membrane protease YdiL (CAAX protease family)